MPTLRHLLAAHAPVLVLDAASARVQVGVLASAESMTWAASEEEAGTGLFRCLETLGAQPAGAGAFLFCDGPGSVLGCRTAAMAVRAWSVSRPRPVYAYRSLEIVAHTLARPGLSIIADARRDAWHCATLGSPLRRVTAEELSGDLAMPEGFRHWAPLPSRVESVSYSLAAMLPRALDCDLFFPTAAPDAFLHEAPSYVTWTPRIHRAPA